MSLRRFAVAIAIAVLAGALAAVPGPAGLTATWTGWLNGGLERYADTAGQWNSGGSPVQAALPGGRALWLVPDSYTGPVGTDGTVNPVRARYAPDALLLTQGSGASFRVLRSVAWNGPRGGGAPAGAVVSGRAVLAVYDGPDGTEIVRMPLASLTRPSTFTVSSAGFPGVQWESLLGSSSCPPGSGLARCVYLYGNRSDHLVEAVAPPSLSGRWRYSAVPGGSGIPVSGGVSVYQAGDAGYVALTGSVSSGITAYYASSPTLAGSAAATLFPAPALPGIPGALAYQFRIEPAYSHGTDVVVGFAVNSADHDQACLRYAPYYDVAAYQPEFYSFTLPSSAESAVPGTLPPPRPSPFRRSPVAAERWSSGSCSSGVPAPSGFRARYAGNGRVDLSWRDPGGLYRYDIRVADSGDPRAGWRDLSYPAWDASSATDTASGLSLAPGHAYQYEISAWNWAGGHSASARASVTLPARITAVTSGLCVTGPALGSCSGQPGWRYVPVAKDGKVTEYALSPLGASGKCLVPSGSSVALGSCSGAARGWEFRIADRAYDFNLQDKATGRCLAVSGSPQSPGARLVQAACSPAPGSLWHSSFEPS